MEWYCEKASYRYATRARTRANEIQDRYKWLAVVTTVTNLQVP